MKDVNMCAIRLGNIRILIDLLCLKISLDIDFNLKGDQEGEWILQSLRFICSTIWHVGYYLLQFMT